MCPTPCRKQSFWTDCTQATVFDSNMSALHDMFNNACLHNTQCTSRFCCRGVNASLRIAGSVCKMKRNVHCICPEDNFLLLQGEDMLTEYRVRPEK